MFDVGSSHFSFIFMNLPPAYSPGGCARASRMDAARWLGVLAVLLTLAAPAHAAELDGRQLSVWWGVPFVGILLSIAICPLLVPHVWHHHFGKIAAGWALAFLLPFAAV